MAGADPRPGFLSVVTKRWADNALSNRATLAVNIIVVLVGIATSVAAYLAQDATVHHHAVPSDVAALANPLLPPVTLTLTALWLLSGFPLAFIQIVRERMKEGTALAATLATEREDKSPKLLIQIERVTVNAQGPTETTEDPSLFVYASVSNDGADSAAHQWEVWLTANGVAYKGTDIALPYSAQWEDVSLFAGTVDWVAMKATGDHYNRASRLADQTREPITRGRLIKGFIAVKPLGAGRLDSDALRSIMVRCRDYRHTQYEAALLKDVEPSFGTVCTSAELKSAPPARRLARDDPGTL